MGYRVRAGAAIARSGKSFDQTAGSPAIGLWAVEDTGIGDSRHFPEIDCVRPLLAADTLVAAEQRAAATGVGADRVLIASGALSEETYLRALGETLGVAFEALDGTPRALCAIDDERLIEAAAAGMLPLALDDDLCLVVAPRGAAARQIMRLIEDSPARARRFRFTSAERLNRFVLRNTGKALAARASNRLKQTWPMLSAAPPRRFGNIVTATILALVSLAAVMLTPAATMLAFEAMLTAVFLAWLGLRLAGVFVAPHAPDRLSRLTDDRLPVYTVISALYKEAASVDGLLSALERLEYPAEKLDVILAVEADDRETRAAIAARKSRIPIAVIPIPVGGPRTKPKALNVALPFARGTFTVVYDAEDRPEPDQLRRALQAFRANGDDLACVQARLCIDNTADNWLTRGIMAQTPPGRYSSYACL